METADSRGAFEPSEVTMEVQPSPDGAPWASRYLADIRVSYASASRRGAMGLGLAAVYGVAMGVGGDAVAIAQSTVTVLSILLSVVGLALPALYIVLALFDTPLTPLQLVDEASRAVFRTGLLLAGMAPAVALYASTTHEGFAFALALGGLYLAGLAGLLGLASNIWAALRTHGGMIGAGRVGALGGFGLFAVALVIRISGNFPNYGVIS